MSEQPCREVIQHEARLNAQNERLNEHINHCENQFAAIYDKIDTQIAGIYTKIDGLMKLSLYGFFIFVFFVVAVLLMGSERTLQLISILSKP